MLMLFPRPATTEARKNFWQALPERGNRRRVRLFDRPSPENTMVLCPVALAVGCRKCPIFEVCPVKGVIGDYKPEDDAKEKSAASDGKKKK